MATRISSSLLPPMFHVGGEPEHVPPRQRSDHGERAGNDHAISPQHRFLGAVVGHLSGMAAASPSGRCRKMHHA